MKAAQLAILVFVSGIESSASSSCLPGDPAKFGSQLMALFSNSPGKCATTTTKKPTTLAPGATTTTTKKVTTKAKTTTTTKKPTTTKKTTTTVTTVNTTTTMTTTQTNTTTTQTMTTTNTTTTMTTTTTNTSTTPSTSTNTSTATSTTATTTITNATVSLTTTTSNTSTTVTTTQRYNSTTTTTTMTTTTSNTTTTMTTTQTNTTTTMTTTMTNTTTTVTMTTTNVTTTEKPTTTKKPTTTTTKKPTTTKKATTKKPTTTKQGATTKKTTTKCITPVPCGTAPKIAQAGTCNSIAADKTQSCNLVTTNGLIDKCMGGTGSFSCPANNQNAEMMPDYVTEGGIKCKPCSASTTVTDKDPVANQVWVSLEWGPLMSSTGVFAESDVDSYSVHIVDNKGRSLLDMGKVAKVASTTNCCTATLYSISVAGTLPTGYDKFMIVPNSGLFSLPMGFLTESITDNAQGLAEKVTGSFTLQVSNIEEAKKNPAFRDAVREGIADSIEGVSKDLVRIVSIEAAATRRLRPAAITPVETPFAKAAQRLLEHQRPRRLAAGGVVVNYEIILPESYSGPAIGASTITATALKTNINKRVGEKDITGITVTEVKDISVPVTASIGTPGSSGGACRNAPLGLFAALVVMAASFRILGVFC